MPFTPLAEDQAQPPAAGFTPLASSAPPPGFTPLQSEDDGPSIGKAVALNNPLTAIGEAGLNLASQAIAMPVAGLAGLAMEVGNALGLTDRTGADTVHQVGEALTYEPRGEMGKQAAGILAYPFEKLAEAGQWAGGKTLDATNSPLAATAVDTAVNALPMLIGPAKKGLTATGERIASAVEKPLADLAPPHDRADSGIQPGGRCARSCSGCRTAWNGRTCRSGSRTRGCFAGQYRARVRPDTPAGRAAFQPRRNRACAC